MTDKKDKILVRIHAEHYFEMDRKEIKNLIRKMVMDGTLKNG